MNVTDYKTVSREEIYKAVNRVPSQCCCVTGHRDIPFHKMTFVEQSLRQEIMQAVNDGFNYFLSGFAEGTDFIFARIIAELKKENAEIKLEAAIPYRNRLRQLEIKKSWLFLLQSCDVIGVHSERYLQGCFMKRNRFMVDVSGRVIAIYDGRDCGGTAKTIQYAQTIGKKVHVIDMRDC